jgi:predicted NBD/HSP70 family sugar kinase
MAKLKILVIGLILMCVGMGCKGGKRNDAGYVGIELHEGILKMELYDEKGIYVPRTKYNYTWRPTDPRRVIEMVIETVEIFEDIKEIKRIGVVVVGDVDLEKGIVRTIPNLPQWKDIKLKEILSNQLQKPVYIYNANDVTGVDKYKMTKTAALLAKRENSL